MDMAAVVTVGLIVTRTVWMADLDLPIVLVMMVL
jgi:hypothetical protein